MVRTGDPYGTGSGPLASVHTAFGGGGFPAEISRLRGSIERVSLALFQAKV